MKKDMKKDLIMARDRKAGKKATMHIVDYNGKFAVVNDILGGSVVYTADSVKACKDWFFNRLIDGCTPV